MGELQNGSPCLVKNQETGQTYMGTIVSFTDAVVVVANPHTNEEEVLSHAEVVGGRIITQNKKRKKYR